MRQLKGQFSKIFKTSAGHQFYGELGDPNSYPRPRRELQNLPHRALVTSRNPLVLEGDLVIHKGVSYLLCGQHILSKTHRFLAVEATQKLTWRRVTDIIDPATRVTKSGAEVVLNAALPVALEPTRSFEEVKFSQTKYRVFTHVDLREGDLIGGYKVLVIYDLMGLRVAEVA